MRTGKGQLRNRHAQLFTLAIAALAILCTEYVNASPNVLVYNNLRVVDSEERVAAIQGVISDRLELSSLSAIDVQPILYRLAAAGVTAYIVPANGKESYLDAERAEVNMWKPLQLASWVHSGGTLILLDGASPGGGGANSFSQLLDELMRSAGPVLPRCKGYTFKSEDYVVRRVEEWSPLGRLPYAIKVRPYQGFSGLVCAGDPGTILYSMRGSGGDPRNDVSAASVWRLGAGNIFWIGSSFQLPNPGGGFKTLLAGAVAQSSPPPPAKSPPPSPDGFPPPFDFSGDVPPPYDDVPPPGDYYPPPAE
ncbi:hypothetical protein GPECTOR_14g246 [Gonium pectorale]|uniref:DUF4350 domain-containing protein n=1 Tax=Gonium pectorale TaxID=33097 RepID=A0A150GMI6_GONPE|nr:hypothetical protein GPECTOR_14g246 [Gonium pectorale]|eukprot:KXZ51004.1 hypothetical protein GPECTOR_14g246 [Gonium pectorale]